MEWMSSLSVFLGKSIVISGLLTGYYCLFLRNRLFHRYNRLYLISIVLLSLLVPLVALPLPYTWSIIGHTPVLSGALHAITPGNWNETPGVIVADGSATGRVSWQLGCWVIYSLVAGVLLVGFLRQLRFVIRLLRKYPRERVDTFSPREKVDTFSPHKRVGAIWLYRTSEPGTPFSFLRHIFWNDQLDIHSPQGQQVFRHELYHARQRHTLDLLFLRLLMIVCWPNPFLYWIHRELRTIHEFEADDHALSTGDRYQYAEMLVWQSVHARPSSLLHSFFQSPIKRRITMILQHTSSAAGLMRRIMILPLLLLLLCAFAGRLRPVGTATHEKASTRKAITVVIDAGHGGIDAGAITAAGAVEKKINLELALTIQRLSTEYGVKVLLTRHDDQLAGGKRSIRESLIYRAEWAHAQGADLFVSLHTNAPGEGDTRGAAAKEEGFNIYISSAGPYAAQNARLGSALIDALKGSYATNDNLVESRQNIYVLQHSAMPAALILCGNIGNQKDLRFIQGRAGQETIARDILRGIVRYNESK